MRDLFKWVLKTGFVAFCWVLLLSIHIDGRPIFSYAHEIFVENEVVQSLDEELGQFIERFYATALEVWERPVESSSDF